MFFTDAFSGHYTEPREEETLPRTGIVSFPECSGVTGTLTKVVRRAWKKDKRGK